MCGFGEMNPHQIWYADANGHPKVEIVANTTFFPRQQDGGFRHLDS